jgi:MFS family permease
LAILGAGIIIPLSILFVRREPEDMGLLPDGDPTPAEAFSLELQRHGTIAPPLFEERSWTRPEALRSPTFWRLVFVFGVAMLATSTMGVHRIPSFMDRGLDPRLVAYATALDAVAAGVSIVAMGMLTNRVPARFLGASGFIILTLACFLTIIGDSVPLMFLAMITFGLGVGGMMLMQTYLWADYFGRLHLGSIRGVAMPIT